MNEKHDNKHAPFHKATKWVATETFTVTVARGVALEIPKGDVAAAVIEQLEPKQLEGLKANGKLKEV